MDKKTTLSVVAFIAAAILLVAGFVLLDRKSVV